MTLQKWHDFETDRLCKEADERTARQREADLRRIAEINDLPYETGEPASWWVLADFIMAAVGILAMAVAVGVILAKWAGLT